MNTSAKALTRRIVAKELDRIEQASVSPPEYSIHEATAIFVNLREQTHGLTSEQIEHSKKEYGV